jgi:hypothetical protein
MILKGIERQADEGSPYVGHDEVDLTRVTLDGQFDLIKLAEALNEAMQPKVPTEPMPCCEIALPEDRWDLNPSSNRIVSGITSANLRGAKMEAGIGPHTLEDGSLYFPHLEIPLKEMTERLIKNVEQQRELADAPNRKARRKIRAKHRRRS